MLRLDGLSLHPLAVTTWPKPMIFALIQPNSMSSAFPLAPPSRDAPHPPADAPASEGPLVFSLNTATRTASLSSDGPVALALDTATQTSTQAPASPAEGPLVFSLNTATRTASLSSDGPLLLTAAAPAPPQDLFLSFDTPATSSANRPASLLDFDGPRPLSSASFPGPAGPSAADPFGLPGLSSASFPLASSATAPLPSPSRSPVVSGTPSLAQGTSASSGQIERGGSSGGKKPRPVSVAGTARGLFQGAMDKRGEGRMAGWKRRWFVLKDPSALHYFHDRFSLRELGSIPLAGSVITEDPQSPCVFRIQLGPSQKASRVYVLRASNPAELHTWIHHLRHRDSLASGSLRHSTESSPVASSPAAASAAGRTISSGVTAAQLAALPTDAAGAPAASKKQTRKQYTDWLDY